jgi:hypothetical protein
LVYSLRWLHKAEQPDFELVFVQDGPAVWVNTANLVLLAELRWRAPWAFDWAAMDNITPSIDAFAAAQDGRPVCRH